MFPGVQLFDENKDFENAIVISPNYLELIHVGESKVIDGEFYVNEEDYKNSDIFEQ